MDKEIIDTEEKEPLDIKEQEEAPRGISPLLIIGIVILFVSFASRTANPTAAALLFSLSLIIIILDRLLIRRFDYSFKVKSPLLIIGKLLLLVSFVSGILFPMTAAFLFSLSLIVIIFDRFVIRQSDYETIKIQEEQKILDPEEQKTGKSILRRIMPTPFLIVGILLILIYLYSFQFIADFLAEKESGLSHDYAAWGIGITHFYVIFIRFLCVLFSILMLIADRILIRKLDYKWVYFIELVILFMLPMVIYMM